jgi:hypothetical protein
MLRMWLTVAPVTASPALCMRCTVVQILQASYVDMTDDSICNYYHYCCMRYTMTLFYVTDLSDVCSRPILLALLPGAEAQRLEEETTAQTTTRCLGILKNMFGADQVRSHTLLCLLLLLSQVLVE